MSKKLCLTLLGLIPIIILTSLLNSCGKKSSSGKVRLAFVTNASADFWAYAQAGVQKAESEFDDIEVEFKVGDGTPAKQRELIEALLVRGVKGIAISPTNPSGQKEMLNEWAEKASLITVDSDAVDSDRKFYLGTDNVAAGRKAGELLKEALPDGGKVMAFVGLGDQANAVERYQGLREAVEGTEIEILDLRTDEVDFGKARRNAEDTLTKHPDIAGMVGLWSYNAPLILEAVRDKGVLDKVKIIGFDEDPRTLKAIDAGEIHGTVVQKPYEFGYQAVVALRAMVVGGQTPKDLEVPDTNQKFIETLMIRKGEGLNYLEKCNAWKESINK
ncbi:MAG: ABC transporter substrate-binding protein [Verrucomicrobia bacterium]|jgi:ribose transport system substrate-binding protein|nr:ABC transporter substrate-binding protein [Roseibacillus sp.]MBB21413.1 ABC transporter substrate-binding protein [Roseibacillus sp.]RCL33031.1 MAG: ABC transporter substrate-binding protein [Verrucomicrobiota bacterium]RPF92327.1 MAG: ABC transporter substrate-binding protein [Roseibacillus sp. TMED18]|tara:strand:- start:7911 stop:8900 length:990 start_codon:yes stop_codon:yes gene_type:complete